MDLCSVCELSAATSDAFGLTLVVADGQHVFLYELLYANALRPNMVYTTGLPYDWSASVARHRGNTLLAMVGSTDALGYGDISAVMTVVLLEQDGAALNVASIDLRTVLEGQQIVVCSQGSEEVCEQLFFRGAVVAAHFIGQEPSVSVGLPNVGINFRLKDSREWRVSAARKVSGSSRLTVLMPRLRSEGGLAEMVLYDAEVSTSDDSRPEPAVSLTFGQQLDLSRLVLYPEHGCLLVPFDESLQWLAYCTSGHGVFDGFVSAGLAFSGEGTIAAGIRIKPDPVIEVMSLDPAVGSIAERTISPCAAR